jgi:hypothetical protein
LTEARNVLAALAVERDALRARLEEAEDRLARVHREFLTERETLQTALDQARKEHTTWSQAHEALAKRADQLVAQLARVQRSAAEARAALSASHEAAAASADGDVQRRRAEDLQRELTATHTARCDSRRDQTRATRLILESEWHALQEEAARLRSALADSQRAADTRRSVFYWEKVGRGELPLDALWLDIAKGLAPTAGRAPRQHQPALAPVADQRPTPSLEQMLQWVGGEVPPDGQAAEGILAHVETGGLSTFVQAAARGDRLVRRGAGRVCHWLATKSRQLGDFPRARDASEQAVRLFAQLAKELPSDHTVGAELVLCRLTQAACERSAGRCRESLDLLVAARETARVLVADQPGVAPYRRLLARSLHDLGVLLERIGRASRRR